MLKIRISAFGVALALSVACHADADSETLGDYASRPEATRIAYSRMIANLLKPNHGDLTPEYLFKCLDDSATYPANRAMRLKAAVIGCANWTH